MVVLETLYLSVRGMSVTRELGLYLYSQDGSYSALSPEVYGDIALGINTQHNTIQCGMDRILVHEGCMTPFDF